jgi:proline racemase
MGLPQGFVVESVEVHAAGEAGRVITNMGHLIEGDTMAERFEFVKKNFDGFRKLIIREPRGYPAVCGVFITPPVAADSHYGIIVLEQGQFTPMSGSNTICSVTAMLETGRIPMQEPSTEVRIDTAVGQITVIANCKDGKVTSVQIENVPAFVVHKDYPLELQEYGVIPTDIIFGGQFFAQTDIANFGLTIDTKHSKELLKIGALIKLACNEQIQCEHPENPNIKNVNLIVLHSGTPTKGVPIRNTMVMTYASLSRDPETWTGTFDRSPCGTGTSARVAGLHARGLLPVGESFIHESIIGTHFIGKNLRETKVGQYDAVVPEITGTGWIMGEAKWVIDPTDPFQEGYSLPDIWPPE